MQKGLRGARRIPWHVRVNGGRPPAVRRERYTEGRPRTAPWEKPMETSDSVVAKGWVDPYFFSPSTGERRPFGKRRNSVSYTGASAMAIAWSGDSSFIPSEVGIIYVSPSSAAYWDFGSDSSGSGGSVNQLSVSRIQSWSSLTAELDSAGASIL